MSSDSATSLLNPPLEPHQLTPQHLESQTENSATNAYTYLRKRADALPLSDTLAAFLFRAEAAKSAVHKHLVRVLNVGMEDDQGFVVCEKFEGGDLKTLITDIGPMPAKLAAEFGSQAARGLEAIHARGLWHGDVRPCNIFAGPLMAMSKPKADGTPRYRPAPTSTIKIGEWGTTPRLLPALEWTASDAEREHALYLPPERFTRADFTGPGDIYTFGAALFFLLSGRAPYTVAPFTELHEKKLKQQSAALDQIRPDVPKELVTLIKQMMHTEPMKRPSATSVAEALHAIVLAPAPAAKPSVTEPMPGGSASGHEIASLSGVNLDAEAPIGLASAPAPNGFVPMPYAQPAYTPPAYGNTEADWGTPASGGVDLEDVGDEPSTPRVPKKPLPKVSRTKIMFWIFIGLMLQVAAVGIWVLMFMEPWKPDSEETTPAPEPVKKTAPQKPGKKQ